MVLDIKYNCGCAYELEQSSYNDVVATKIALCQIHKTQLSPPQAELTV